VIQNVIIRIDEERIFSGWSDYDDWRWQILGVHDMVVVKGEFARVDTNLRSAWLASMLHAHQIRVPAYLV
jgi:hypothetical protein